MPCVISLSGHWEGQAYLQLAGMGAQTGKASSPKSLCWSAIDTGYGWISNFMFVPLLFKQGA